MGTYNGGINMGMGYVSHQNYVETHRQQINEKTKRWRETHKEHWHEQGREYREKVKIERGINVTEVLKRHDNDLEDDPEHLSSEFIMSLMRG